MIPYAKPLFSPVHDERESAGCCFFFNNAGQGVYYYPGSGGSGNGGASVGNNSASVTPLCGTGLPATQPQTFGIPLGTTGLVANVGADGSVTFALDPNTFGASVAGTSVGPGGNPAGLPRVEQCISPSGNC